MASNTVLTVESRETTGKAWARRMRRQGRVPAIVYGGGKDPNPKMVSLSHDDISHNLEHESFFSSMFSLEIDGKTEKVVLKNVQRHPARPVILHVDFLRVNEDSEINMAVPVHFINVEKSAGVKAGGVFDPHYTELEIRCLARNLPEAIEVDVAKLNIGDTINLTEISLPTEVKISAFIGLSAEEILSHDQPIAHIHASRISPEETEEEAEESIEEEEQS